MANKIFVNLKEYPNRCSLVFDIKSELGDLKNIVESIGTTISNEFSDVKEQTEIKINVFDSTFRVNKNLDKQEENILDDLENRTGINREIIRVIRRAEEIILDEIVNELEN